MTPMDLGRLREDLKADIERIGAAGLVVGVATVGPSPAIPSVGAAIRASLDAHLSGRPAVVIHVDHGPSDDAAALLVQALGELRVLRVPPSHTLHPTDGESGWSDTVQMVLALGRMLDARAIVMLNADIISMTPEWVRGLWGPILKEDYGLVLPVYQRNRYEGTLTQGLVVPVVRALFGRQLWHPLAEEFGCSAAAADFFLQQGVWSTDLGRHGLEFWLPVAAIEHGLPIGQAVLGVRTLASPAQPAPLGPTVGRVAGALFSLAEQLESVWLEVRGSEPVAAFGALPEPLAGGGGTVDPERMLLGFRQGVRDLLPIWERILASENLGDVLALSDSGTEEFRFEDRLWARTVYDFLLAYRARVMYGSHLAQSLAPLYLGRVASLVLETRTRPAAAVVQAGERAGRVFEEQKPYLVDRWR